jgi:hypothetical protein
MRLFVFGGERYLHLRLFSYRIASFSEKQARLNLTNFVRLTVERRGVMKLHEFGFALSSFFLVLLLRCNSAVAALLQSSCRCDLRRN